MKHKFWITEFERVCYHIFIQRANTVPREKLNDLANDVLPLNLSCRNSFRGLEQEEISSIKYYESTDKDMKLFITHSSKEKQSKWIKGCETRSKKLLKPSENW